MYIVNGIAYAGDPAPVIKVLGVRPLSGHHLWLRFSTGETKIFNFSALLATPAFAPLADETVFKNVYIDYGVTVWNDGDIDIAPELLYQDGVLVDETATA